MLQRGLRVRGWHLSGFASEKILLLDQTPALFMLMSQFCCREGLGTFTASATFDIHELDLPQVRRSALRFDSGLEWPHVRLSELEAPPPV